MAFERLSFDVVEGVGEITLCCPERANAIDLVAAEELVEVSLACQRGGQVRAALLRASGPIFCAGGDLASFAASGDDLAGLLERLTDYLHAAVSRFARMDAPLIVAVGGTAAGAGMSLALAGDVVVAADTARFTMAYTRVGLVPDGSSTFFLPRRIGTARARDLMLRNRVLGAAEALDWGLVDEVVPAADLDARSREVARSLAAGPTKAYGAVKRLLLDGEGRGLESQMRLEALAIADASRSEDARAGIAAFLAKKTPDFTGR